MKNSLVIFLVFLLVPTINAAEPPSPMFSGLSLEPAPPIAKEPAPMLFGLSQETICENGVCRPVENGFGLVPIAPVATAPVATAPVATAPVAPVSQPVTPIVSTPIAPVVYPVAQPMSVPIYETATPVYFEPVQVQRQRFRPFRRFLERRRRIFRARWCR